LWLLAIFFGFIGGKIAAVIANIKYEVERISYVLAGLFTSAL
jgi:hypothetical protein